MEQQSQSQEQINIARAQAFIAEHSPGQEDVDAYQATQAIKIYENQRVWMVRNVDGPGRCYDLFNGPRGIAASIEWDAGEYGSDTYSILVLSEDDQVELTQEITDLRHLIDPTGQRTRGTELQILARALEMADRYADTL